MRCAATEEATAGTASCMDDVDAEEDRKTDAVGDDGILGTSHKMEALEDHCSETRTVSAS